MCGAFLFGCVVTLCYAVIQYNATLLQSNATKQLLRILEHA